MYVNIHDTSTTTKIMNIATHPKCFFTHGLVFLAISMQMLWTLLAIYPTSILSFLSNRTLTLIRFRPLPAMVWGKFTSKPRSEYGP